MSMLQLTKRIIDFNENSEKFLQSLNELLSSSSGTHNSCDIIEIQKCPSLPNASKFISQATNRTNIFKKIPSIFAIKFQIECKSENFNLKEVERPKKNEFETRVKILVSFEEFNGKQKIIYWKNSKEETFLTLKFDNQQLSSFMG
ncbi:hypothetical protein PVAND_014733 [Polypedilum vanderplanki]|uniref:Uncharacterized protein n=1 Tax=Polypedilum vanderplanki TaxID=319348 RepID=A0A9J6BAW6_POLVA|nr:hypothetical protein PVAND_014733 [Polypedilum vanderplanki]